MEVGAFFDSWDPVADDLQAGVTDRRQRRPSDGIAVKGGCEQAPNQDPFRN